MTRTNEHHQQIGEPVDWEPRQPPAPVVLQGRWMRLEPLAAAHAAGLHDALCGEARAPLWTYRPDTMPTDVADYARRIAALAAETESRTWAIVPAGATAPAGSLSLYRIFPDQGSAEVAAVIFGPALQRTSAATEAVVRLGEYLFEELGYRRYEWKCDSLNEPSRRAASRLGFTYEGRFRNAMVYQGRNRDTDWYSITDAEWASLRPAYDAWLDPANFDDDGRQRRSLSGLTSAVRRR